MAEIIIRGKKVIVDDNRLSEINKYKWFFDTDGYARRSVKGRSITMHHDIIGRPVRGMVVDHINRNKLDNRACNLRFCTISQNSMNKKLQSNNTSGYRGVYFRKSDNKWLAIIRVSGRRYYGGSFEDRISAAIAYNELAKNMHGEFAVLNHTMKG